MRLVSFEHAGAASFGIVSGDGIVDAGRRLGPDTPDLMSALERREILRELAGESVDVGLAEANLRPPIERPFRIVCVGLNYKSHIHEVGREMPAHPILFSRYPDSHVGHGGEMVRPRVSEHFDYEGELAFVIGKPGRHVRPEAALDHVAGYACYNDGSIRDFQRHTSQFMPGKNFWHSGAFGPWLVTADEIPDPGALVLTTRLNGEVVQQAETSDLLFGVAQLIAYMSQIWPLRTGDVVATGTTGGVGAARKPPLWMKAGDRVEVDISGIGTLANRVVDE